ERPHGLPNEVRRRYPGDTEAVGGFRGDRRFARAGRAADEDDHRQIELLKLAQAAEPPDRLRALLLAQHLDRELLDTIELDGLLPAVDQILVDPLRELVGPTERAANRDQRPRHQPLRVRVFA